MEAVTTIKHTALPEIIHILLEQLLHRTILVSPLQILFPDHQWLQQEGVAVVPVDERWGKLDGHYQTRVSVIQILAVEGIADLEVRQESGCTSTACTYYDFSAHI